MKTPFNPRFRFGTKVKHIITGEEGYIVTRIQYITLCDDIIISLIERKGDEERTRDNVKMFEFVDSGFAEKFIDKSFNSITDLDETKFEFGDELRDTITGMTGKVITKKIDAVSDIGYAISPKFDRDSRNNDAEWFDETRLEYATPLKQPKQKPIQNSPEVVTPKRTGGIAKPQGVGRMR